MEPVHPHSKSQDEDDLFPIQICYGNYTPNDQLSVLVDYWAITFNSRRLVIERGFQHIIVCRFLTPSDQTLEVQNVDYKCV